MDYRLLGVVFPSTAVADGASALELDSVAGVGFTVQDDKIVMESSDEDAVENLSDASRVVTRALDRVSAQVEWEPQAPRYLEDGREAMKVDGYWIAASRGDDHRE